MEKNKKIKLNETANFIEELAWLFDKRRQLSLMDMSMAIRELESYNREKTVRYFSGKINDDTRSLVGILPSLFMDSVLFKTREDILDFAESILGVNISRASNRSKFEYIGIIVCEVAKINSEKLTDIVSALNNIIGSDDDMVEIKKARKEPNFSWNDTIRKLGK